MELLKKFIEGYDEQKALETLTEKDYWQDVIRAEQNRLIVQEPLEGIEIHFDVPCAVVYMGNIKGIIPVHEFGINKENYVNSREDLTDKEKLNNSYRFLRSMTGQKIAFIIKGHDKENNLFTASRKEALEWMKKRAEEELAAGDKTIAVVRNVNPYRAIADIGGIPAVMLSAEYQHGWTDDLTEHVQVGDHIMVKIINFDKEKGRAIISRKALIPDPWENLELREKCEYACEIMGVRENGCFFRVKTKSGYVDGFLKHPRHELLNRGDKALVRILNIDKDKRRIFGLYLRPLKVS
ncbi:S1 RNA-binding domain-containing protein [Zhaonella formicivorans]|uniref:S1 RNA-binding domain-containing protein n=1 Tax=Zhaonella formicivorans TaxID=2528593 RepID=UPI0010DF5F7F|nr:S1 RNA-binding domain-containing protein [Zhaonella formicivorans]